MKVLARLVGIADWRAKMTASGIPALLRRRGKCSRPPPVPGSAQPMDALGHDGTGTRPGAALPGKKRISPRTGNRCRPGCSLFSFATECRSTSVRSEDHPARWWRAALLCWWRCPCQPWASRLYGVRVLRADAVSGAGGVDQGAGLCVLFVASSSSTSLFPGELQILWALPNPRGHAAADEAGDGAVVIPQFNGIGRSHMKNRNNDDKPVGFLKVLVRRLAYRRQIKTHHRAGAGYQCR